ncbi:type II toxin-antitoxin system YoeB family toxin [Lactiplantibacillus carotarum]|nr:type II toxin-antitoxin system YoeB family toxin [Lactiplantibacillus carotarum]
MIKYQAGWSRRINSKDRLVYTIKHERLLIVAGKNHYE